MVKAIVMIPQFKLEQVSYEYYLDRIHPKFGGSIMTEDEWDNSNIRLILNSLTSSMQCVVDQMVEYFLTINNNLDYKEK